MQELFNRCDELTGLAKQWAATADNIKKRQPVWSELVVLLEHAKGLGPYADLKAEVDAVRDHRTLLADPDPVRPLLDRTSDVLRSALNVKLQGFQTEFAHQQAQLAADSDWARLSPAQSDQLAAAHHLQLAKVPDLATPAQLQDALDDCTLQHWISKTQALPSKFESARHAAVTLLKPNVVYVPLPKRTLNNEACQGGARMVNACRQIAVSVRTVLRWRHPKNKNGDGRMVGNRAPTIPPNKLSQAERKAALDLLNSQSFKDLPPSQIVPRLADQGLYVASESTLYRLLRAAGQMTHRRAERVPSKIGKPRALLATQADQIYCWDITYLPAQVRGTFFYLYLFVDIFSRKIVGWQVFERESAALASELLIDICRRQAIDPDQLTVHSDNGSPMKGETMLATMQRLGVAHSRSRPAVSNGNPYSESLFRTLKYRPQLPLKPFESLLQARNWTSKLVLWYNEEHRHSAIGFVTPGQRHAGADRALLSERSKVYEAARQANPERWSKQIRNWQYVKTVHLNPEKSQKKDDQTIKNIT